MKRLTFRESVSITSQPQVYSGLNSPLPKKKRVRRKSVPKQFRVVDFRGEELFRGTIQEIATEFGLSEDTVRKKISTKHKIKGMYSIERIKTETP